MKLKMTFSTMFLLSLTAVVAGALALTQRWGFVFLLPYCLTLFCCNFLLKKKYMVAALIGTFAVCSLLTIQMFPYPEIRVPNNSTVCACNLRQILNAIQNYELANGSLPPVCKRNKDGTPMHSWRVLILPYLERRDLYDRYDFSKPWDHPDNLKIADEGACIFNSCPTTKLPKNRTNYVAVIGENSQWLQPSVKTTIENPRILIVESFAHQPHWMAPSDFSADTEGSTLIGIHGYKRDSVSIGFSDGTVKLIGASAASHLIEVAEAEARGAVLRDDALEKTKVSDKKN